MGVNRQLRFRSWDEVPGGLVCFLGSQDQCRLSQQWRFRLQNTLPRAPSSSCWDSIHSALAETHVLAPCPMAGHPSPDSSPPSGVAAGSLPLPRGWGGRPWRSRASSPPLKAPRPWGEPKQTQQRPGCGYPGGWGADRGPPSPPDLSSEDSRNRLCPRQTMLHS